MSADAAEDEVHLTGIAPPLEVKKRWRRIARAKQKREFLRNPDDPVITPFKRLVEIWAWY